MLVTLARFLDPWEAHVVCARLRADGLFAEVANDRMALVDWPLSFSLGGTQLQVKAEDIAEARAILEAYRRGELDIEREWSVDAEVEAACTCPPQGPIIPWRERLLVITLFVASLGTVTYPTRTIGGLCATCGKMRPA
jgi:hypothetical protein